MQRLSSSFSLFRLSSLSSLSSLFAIPALLAALAPCAACGARADRAFDGTSTSGTTPPEGQGGGFASNVALEADAAAPKDECSKMDVVFVIDDSGSMQGKQEKLRANFPKFVDVLDAFRTKSGARLDYRLAVTSTDTERADYKTGGRGGFVTTPVSTCSPGPPRTWLERTDVGVASAFACRAGLGVKGTAEERPLQALFLALTDRLDDHNRDFLRSDALLSFLILSDEEDSGLDNPTPVGLVRKLDQVKQLRGRWAGAVISGPEKETCNGGALSATGGGNAAPRLHDFVKQSASPATGKSNVIWRSVCQDTFDVAVKDALDTFTLACLNLPPLPR